VGSPDEYTFNCRHLRYSWQKANKPPWTKLAVLRNVPIVQVLLPDDGDGKDLLMKLEEAFKQEMTYPGPLENAADCVWVVTYGVSHAVGRPGHSWLTPLL
jgi:hypothetical protein